MENPIRDAISYLRRWQYIASENLELIIREQKEIKESLNLILFVSFWRHPLIWLCACNLKRKNMQLEKRIAKQKVKIIEWAWAESMLRKGNIKAAIKVFDEILGEITPELYNNFGQSAAIVKTTSPMFFWSLKIRDALLSIETRTQDNV